MYESSPELNFVNDFVFKDEMYLMTVVEHKFLMVILASFFLFASRDSRIKGSSDKEKMGVK